LRTPSDAHSPTDHRSVRAGGKGGSPIEVIAWLGMGAPWRFRQPRRFEIPDFELRRMAAIDAARGLEIGALSYASQRPSGVERR